MPATEVSKEELIQLLQSSEKAIDEWTDVVTISKDAKTSIEPAKVDSPPEEMAKLSGLIKAHTTKIAIVFKPVVQPQNYRAAFKEVEATLKVLILLVSVAQQLKSQIDKYSKTFTTEVLRDSKTLLSSYSQFFKELEENLDATTSDDDNDRLPTVGRIWVSCDSIQATVLLGTSGILKKRIKLTNSLIADALKEYNEWLENPDQEDLDEFDDEPEQGEPEPLSPLFTAFAQSWGKKIAMVKLLLTSLNKSLPNSVYSTAYSKEADLLDAKRDSLSEVVDDLVAEVIYDHDEEAAKETAAKLSKQCIEIATIVKKLNSNNETRQKWLDTWTSKFQD